MALFDSIGGGKRSVQDLIGAKVFTSYGVQTEHGELVFFQVRPINISVLSSETIETKIRNLTYILSAYSDIEMICTDSSECFDDNKAYFAKRIEEEMNPMIRGLLAKDREFLDSIQLEMATARQFAFIMRYQNLKPEQIFQAMNNTEKLIAERGFEVRRMSKEDIKRFLALYFEASYNGDQIPDVDGLQYFEPEGGYYGKT